MATGLAPHRRIVLPVRRFLLDAAKVGARIPALGDRQFVLSKAKLSEAEQLRMQTLFWYREELMGLVEAVWHEVRRTLVLLFRLRSLSRLTPACPPSPRAARKRTQRRPAPARPVADRADA